MPSTLDTSVLSRHDADPRKSSQDLGALQVRRFIIRVSPDVCIRLERCLSNSSLDSSLMLGSS